MHARIKSYVCVWLQEALRILSRFGYKTVTDQFLIMADNFRPENCFVIQVCVCEIFCKVLNLHFVVFLTQTSTSGAVHTIARGSRRMTLVRSAFFCEKLCRDYHVECRTSYQKFVSGAYLLEE